VAAAGMLVEGDHGKTPVGRQFCMQTSLVKPRFL